MMQIMEALALVVKPIRRTKFISNIPLNLNDNSLFSTNSFKTCCSNNTSQQPQQSGNDNDDSKDNNNKKGDKLSIDWDKAWSSFKKQGRKSLSSQFSPNKYVTWNPRRSNYPLSEEVDPIKKTERSNLMFWTSPKFTLGGAIVIVSLLLIYTILAPMK